MPTTNNRVREAFEENRIIRRLASDPPAGNLEGGEMWFNTTDGAWRGYDGSSYVTFDVTADA
ncbi:hypothetical protein CP556_08670 [Natrinema sp. CBA1119]|uniref:hypothetical protein n=1 Tax=Natrinema sp. CBA1119 TaxID=1608465 RepID=UPI000BF68EB7|nr:hypothetical protein [Natrinema sp. CBA1119]PGF16177.1 hypothetical protein CP556_08670 [Natrinema sp. CBA1119]